MSSVAHHARLFLQVAGRAKRLPTWTPQPGPQTDLFNCDADEILYGGAAGGGKALALDTPVPTPSGWTTMGQLLPGDAIFGADGTVCTVQWCSPIMVGNTCYEVEFSDGSTIVADAGHLWVTHTYKDRVKLSRRSDEYRDKRRAGRAKRGTGKRPDLAARNATRVQRCLSAPAPSVRTTDAIRETLFDGERVNHSIDVCGSLRLPHAEIPIDPYVLGMWLGDGTSESGAFTTADPELAAAYQTAGYRVTKKSAVYGYCAHGLFGQLRVVGLLGNKHIPTIYLRASAEQRLALLQGLMDTDGTADADDGHCEFTTMSTTLRDGVLELVLSLGIKATSREGRAMLNGRDVGPKWRIKFIADCPVFRLARKLERQKTAEFRGTHRRRYIVAIKRVDSVPVRCIGVDSQSHCFLAGRAMIPTHNSSAAVAIPTQRVKMRGYRALILRRSTPDLKNLIDEAKSIYQDGREGGAFAFSPFSPGNQSKFRGDINWMQFPEWGSRIEFSHCHNDDDYRPHMGQQYDDIVFDEGTQFTRQQYENIITRRRGTIKGIRRRAIVTANPPEASEPGDEWVRQKWAPWVDPVCKVEGWIGVDEGGLGPIGEYVPPQQVTLVGLPERTVDGKPMPPAVSGQILYVAKDKSDTERFSAKPFVWNGATAQRRTFIRSSLRDNPAMLEATPDYASTLRTAGAVRAQQLEEGDWTVRLVKGSLFQRSWFEVIDAPPNEKDVVGRCRAWDKAATEPSKQNPDPDWTRGLRGCKLKDGTIVIEDLVSCRFSPGPRDDLILSTAKADGKGCRIRGQQNPSDAGVTDAVAFRRLLESFIVKTETASGSKVLRAGNASSLSHPKSTGGAYGRIKVLRGNWNIPFFDEIESFPLGAHDDIVDALSDLVDELINHMRDKPAPPPPPLRPINFESRPIGF